MIEGEATSESFGAGNRATAALVDECARIEPEPAQYIIDNIHDTTPCCIYNSTHFRWGAGHPYAKLLRSGKIEIITLAYEDNPEKNYGMYRSPHSGEIEIKDIEYYRQRCPAIFSQIEAGELVSTDWLEEKVLLADKETQQQMSSIRFVADGGESNFGRWRSVWFDEESVDRCRSQMDISQNILRVAQGSADMFFDTGMIERLKSRFVKKPNRTGEVNFAYRRDGSISDVKWSDKSKGRVRWWGQLENGKPDKCHNYIVSCDISYGRGASNSVAAVCDVNTQELCGLFVDPFININDFADYAVALAKWLGNAYLIWEANGPGNEFDHRVRFQKYGRVYIPRNERQRKRKKQNKRGWISSPGVNGTKIDMLNRLDAALLESLRDPPLSTYIIVHDEQTLRELEDYIFSPSKIDVEPSSLVTETSGARYAHGDRVIALGMAVMAMETCPKAVNKMKIIPKRNTFQYRWEQAQKEKLNKPNGSMKRVWLYG
jgi:hypothetical protein